jgi:SNF2 family DNA or RNA helicase
MIALMDILQPEVANSVRTMAFMSNAPQFRKKAAPVYYRRKREQVLAELPDLIENMEWCQMNAREEEVYIRTLWSGNLMAVRRVSWNVDDLQYSTKAQRLKEIVEEARDDDRKVIVFSFFLDTLGKVCQLLGDACVEPINGSVPPARRQEIIDEFDSAPAGSVLPAQIMSGGTGLNIQSASVVVICEPQYKPSTENQAISRAYRMGQARNVLVYRLMSDDTVDERILEILTRKQAEFDAFADRSVAGDDTIELDDGAMGDIIKGEIERIKALKGSSVFEKAKNAQI